MAEEDNEQTKKKEQPKELSAVDKLLTELWACYEYEPTLIAIHLRVEQDDKGKAHTIVSIIQSTKIGSNVDLLNKINPLSG